MTERQMAPGAGPAGVAPSGERRIGFQFTQADTIDAVRTQWQSVFSWQGALRLFCLLWVIYIVVFMGIVLILDGGRPGLALASWSTAVPLAAGIALAVTVILYGLGYLFIPWRGRRLFREQKSLAGGFDLAWDEQGFDVRHAHGGTQLPWAMLHSWCASPTMLLAFQSSALFNAVPRRALSPGQVDDLVGLLRRAGVRERRRFGVIAAPGRSR